MTDDSPAKPDPEAKAIDESLDEAGLEDMEEATGEPFTAADFHNVVQKQLAYAAGELLAQAKLPWSMVEPLLDAARTLVADELREAGRIRLHTLRAEGDSWVDAEEAFLGIEIPDRDTGAPWLSETWWLSDIATADGDPEEVRAIVQALERTIARLNDWLTEQGGPGGKGESKPPEPESEAG
jgi:hypothetical protein